MYTGRLSLSYSKIGINLHRLGQGNKVVLDLPEDTLNFSIGPFEFKVEGRSKTAGTAEGCDFWDQNGVLLLHLRVQQQRKSKINELTMSDVIE